MNPFKRRIRSRHRFHQIREGHQFSCPQCSRSPCTLADVPAGCQAQVTGFANQLNTGRGAQLNAYGLAPGRWIRVIQNSPVIVVQIDLTEIALEQDLARGVNVRDIKQDVRQD